MVDRELRPAPNAAGFFVARGAVELPFTAEMKRHERSLFKRLAKLEAKDNPDDRIPIYVRYRGEQQDIEANVQKRIDELMGLGALSEADRRAACSGCTTCHTAKWMLGGERKRQLDRQAALGNPEWLNRKRGQGTE